MRTLIETSILMMVLAVAGCSDALVGEDLGAAAYRGDVAQIEQLLKSGHDINARGRGNVTPLIMAARQGRTNAVRVLLAGGAETDLATDDGYTAVMMAAARGHDACLELLVDQGADVEKTGDEVGLTPLMLAAGRGHTACTRILLAGGAKTEAKDNQDDTALLKACHGGGSRHLGRAVGARCAYGCPYGIYAHPTHASCARAQ